MNSDQNAGARFVFGSCVPLTGNQPVTLAWTTELDTPGAVGQAVVDGQVIVAASGQRARHMTRSRRGQTVVAAHLIEAGGKPGTWRFDFSGEAAFKSGSVRVVVGTVALITPDAVVFRLQGKAGERVVFTFEID
jgi:hypothetical protein